MQRVTVTLDDELVTETALIPPSGLMRISRCTVPLSPRRRAASGYWSDSWMRRLTWAR